MVDCKFLFSSIPFTIHRSVFLVRAEELTHGMHSEWSKEWWTVSDLSSLDHGQI